MPLLMISSLPPRDANSVPQMLADIRDSGARALKCSPDNVWVMFNAIAPGFYLHGQVAAAAPQATTHPPVVVAKLQAGRTLAELDAFVAAVAAAVGRGLSIPAENVWVQYQEMRSEDVWFHGHWSA